MSVSSLDIVGLFAATGVVLALAVLSLRIVARLNAQAQAVRASEERYRLLFNRSLAGVYQSTLDGRLVDCDDALARMLGYPSSQDMLTLEATDLYTDRAERERWLRQLCEVTSLSNFEHQLKRHDGRLVWVLESATLVPGANGRPPVIEGTVIDITRRKDAEDEVTGVAASLVASLERYRTLVETTSAIPWEMDGKTLVFRYVSPMVARLFRYSTDRAVGSIDVWSQVHDDDRDRVRAQFAALAASQAAEGLHRSTRRCSS